MDRLVAYYAMGGGLGHLTRARAVLHTLGLEEHSVLLTSSRHGTDPRVVGAVPLIHVPPELDGHPAELRLWLDSRLSELRPASLILDTFPAGILGELDDLPVKDTRILHVARRLRWRAYSEMIGPRPPRIETTWVTEPLEAEHRSFLEAQSDRVESLELVDPPEAATPAEIEGTFWLVVHAGPEEEVVQLLLYAAEMQQMERCEAPIVLASPVEPEGVGVPFRRVPLFPASGWFAAASRVISGCGFNVMRQMAPWREKHRYLPFERRFDDQFARAAAVRRQSYRA